MQMLSKIFPRELTERLPAQAKKRLTAIGYQLDKAVGFARDSVDRSMTLRRDIESRKAEYDQFLNDAGVSYADRAKALTALLSDEKDRRGVELRIMVLGGPGSSKQLRDERLEKFRQEIEQLNAELKELTEISEANSAIQQEAATSLRSIKEWLEVLPKGAPIVDDSLPVVLKKREVTPDIIEKARYRIRELLAELKRIDAAPYPKAVAKKRAREEIERLAERGRPNVYPLIEQPPGEDVGIEWPIASLDVRGGGVFLSQGFDGLGLFAWMHREALVAAIDKEIGAAADDELALTDQQRAERFKTCLSDLLQAEREEEALIQAAGFEVHRRAGADPRAVLGLSSALPGPKRNLVRGGMIEMAEVTSHG